MVACILNAQDPFSMNNILNNNLQYFSEFCRLDLSAVSRCIIDFIKENAKTNEEEKTTVKSRLLYEILRAFCEEYSKDTSSYVIKDENTGLYHIKNPYNGLEEKYRWLRLPTKGMDSFNDNDRYTVYSMLDKLVKSYDVFCDKFLKAQQNVPDLSLFESADECIDNYYDLIRNSVFFEGNHNLKNAFFRKSEYLKDLVFPYYKDNPICDEKVGYNVSFIDAYSLDVILLIINDVIKTIGDESKLNCLRSSLLCTMADKAFERYVYLGDETYRITMNRQTSKIVARPFSQRSSLMSVRPIRLYEKIASYLSGFRDDSNRNELTISIIGHCEKSWLDDQREEVELLDLCYAIERLLKDINLSSEKKIQINYYVNKADWYTCRGEDRFTVNAKKIPVLMSDSFSCSIIKTSFIEQFSFSTSMLEEIIKESGMTFILDPAFLYNENYEICTQISIDSYSTSLGSWNGEKRRKQRDLIHLDSISSSSLTEMMFMNAQLNRIMASQTMEAGAVCRVFRDDVIRSIKTAVRGKVETDKSVVYIFSSERVGLDYSGESNYPVVRCEQYNGKTVNIFQYSNYLIPQLKLSEDKTFNIKIPFWSTLKYISLNYAFSVSSLLDINCDAQKKYHLFKSIYTTVNVNPTRNGKYLIKYSVVKGRIDEDLLEGQNSLFERANDVIDALFREVLFSTSTSNKVNFGNQLIKTAFSMNIYSAVDTVQGMYFWFCYQKACEAGDFMKFDVIRDDSISSDENFNMSSVSQQERFFMDKQIYNVLLKQLDTRGVTNFAFASMLAKVEDENIYFNELNVEKKRSMFDALKIVCSELGDSTLCQRIDGLLES